MKQGRYLGTVMAMLLFVLGITMGAAAQQDYSRAKSPPSKTKQPKTPDQQPPATKEQAAPDQTPTPPAQQSMSPESELLSKMHAANQIEIKAGDLAKAKGTTANIRRYGDLLARDHRGADKSISNLAKQQNILLAEPMPKTPEEKQKMEMQKQMLSDLEAAQGAEFDRKFIEFNAKAHEEAVNMVRTGSDQLQPSPVKNLTAMMVPVLQQHKDLADHLAQRLTAAK
jgi:putative membrane protein